ncbi:MAG TPA: winged helix-turn-helix domain-containing protein [Thermoleophilaceae bacterium]
MRAGHTVPPVGTSSQAAPIRARLGGEDELLRFEELELLPSDYQVRVHGVRVPLTMREFETLLALAERPGRVVMRPEIYGRVWGGEMPRRDRSVDVFVRKVRLKLAVASPEWRYIHTHFGIGYRFTAERVPDGGSK